MAELYKQNCSTKLWAEVERLVTAANLPETVDLRSLPGYHEGVEEKFSLGYDRVPQSRSLIQRIMGAPPHYKMVEKRMTGRTHKFLGEGFLQSLENWRYEFSLTWKVEFQENGALETTPQLSHYPKMGLLRQNTAPLVQHLRRSIGKTSEEIIYGGDLIPEAWVPGEFSHNSDAGWPGIHLLKSEVVNHLQIKLRELGASTKSSAS